MTCEICHGPVKVVDSAADKKRVYRIRKCLDCGNRFATIETKADDYKDILYLITSLKTMKRGR